MKKHLVAILCCFAAVASAQFQTAKVTGYIPYESGGRQIFIFQLEGNASGGCNTTSRFAVDSNSLKFKGTQAAIMASFHTQTDVTVVYAQTCGAWVNSWDVVAACVGNIPC
ncbi:hypothetical protein B9Z49_21190 [Limnohabitans sp. 2KL-51]|nr:hypothetical protein B9Z49_21190 [Limnohabitans sp. 2KL-51]